jgi:hypothetical protein
MRSSSSAIAAPTLLQHRLHHVIQQRQLRIGQLAGLTEHAGEPRVGILSAPILADERGDANAEVIGEPRDETHGWVGQRAPRLFTTLISSTERERRKARESELEAAITYKVAWERELERRRRLEMTAADPLPHPDDIVIDVDDGTVVIKGPATKEEKVLWEIWTEQQSTFENDLRELQEYLEDPDATEREEAMRDVAKLTECLKIVQLALNGSRPVLRFLQSVSDSIAGGHPQP